MNNRKPQVQISWGEFALSTLDTIQQLHSQGVCQLSLLGANVAWINVTVNGKKWHAKSYFWHLGLLKHGRWFLMFSLKSQSLLCTTKFKPCWASQPSICEVVLGWTFTSLYWIKAWNSDKLICESRRLPLVDFLAPIHYRFHWASSFDHLMSVLARCPFRSKWFGSINHFSAFEIVKGSAQLWVQTNRAWE